jgi:hypothetical protein
MKIELGRRLGRVEYHPNPLTENLAGDFIVPFHEVEYETIRDDGVRLFSRQEERGKPIYLQSREQALPPEVQLAARAMLYAVRIFQPILRRYFAERDKVELPPEIL